jgi:hypothetical protein
MHSDTGQQERKDDAGLLYIHDANLPEVNEKK